MLENIVINNDDNVVSVLTANFFPLINCRPNNGPMIGLLTLWLESDENRPITKYQPEQW